MEGPPNGVPQKWADLRTLLQGERRTWAPGQRRIAQVVLDDPGAVAFQTIAQTAKLAQVHQSSVNRFCTMLGLKGYPDLVALCREQLTDEVRLVKRFNRAEAEEGHLLPTILKDEQQNLGRTVARIDPAAWTTAVQRIAQSRQVHVMGLRKCLPVAQLFAHLLRLVRPGVQQIAPLAGALVDDLRDLGPEDVFIAVSIDRYTAETVAAFQAAHDRGLYTIALTDTDASPLASVADITFLVECEGVLVLRSIAGFIVLVQALATAVAVHDGARSREELHNDEHLFSQFDVYKR